MSTIKKLKTKIHGKNRIIEAAQNEIDQAHENIDKFENLIDHTNAELFVLEDELHDLEESEFEEE